MFVEPEIRILEIRKKSEIRNPIQLTRAREPADAASSPVILRPSGFGFLSDFEDSDFGFNKHSAREDARPTGAGHERRNARARVLPGLYRRGSVVDAVEQKPLRCTPCGFSQRENHYHSDSSCGGENSTVRARRTDHKFGIGASQRFAKGVKFGRSKSSRGEELRRVERRAGTFRPLDSVRSAWTGWSQRDQHHWQETEVPLFEIGFTGRGDFAMLAALNSDGS